MKLQGAALNNNSWPGACLCVSKALSGLMM